MAPHVGEARGVDAQRHREGRAQQRRRHHQQREGGQQRGEHQHVLLRTRELPRQGGEQAPEGPRQAVQQQGQHRHAGTTAELEGGEEPHRIRVAVHHPRHETRAEEDAEQEAGQGRREGVDGGREADQQDAGPQHLEGEGAEARDPEGEQRDPGDPPSEGVGQLRQRVLLDASQGLGRRG